MNVGPRLGSDIAAGHGHSKVEELLGESGVGGTVGVHIWCEPVTAGNGGISFGLQVATGTNSGLITKKVAEQAERFGLV